MIFFEQTQNMPMLPKVVQEVMQLLNADDGDVKKLVDKINHDQVLSVKILRISNSAYFGRSGKVSTIEKATSLIGLENSIHWWLLQVLPRLLQKYLI